VLVYYIGKKAFDARVGLVASLLACFYGMLILYDALLLRDGFLTFLYLLSILSLLLAQQRRRIRHYILAGFCFGLAVIGRPNVVPFLAPALAWIWLSARPANPRRVAALVGSFLFGATLAISPVTLKNYLVGGELVLIEKQGGLIFYLGNCHDATGTLTLTDSMLRIAPDFVHMSFEEVAKFDWTGMALAQIREDPLHFIRLLFKKLYLFWASYEIPNNVNYYLSRHSSFVLKLPLIPFWLIFPLFVTGVICSVRKWWPGPALIILFTLTYMASILLLFVVARYRLSIVPLLLVFAGYAIIWWYDRVKERNYKNIALSLLPLTIAGVFSVATRSDYIRPNDYFNLGLSYHMRGQYEQAIKHYRNALNADPHFNPARGNLLDCYLDLGRRSEALDLARDSVVAEPYNAKAFVGLAAVFLDAGQNDHAIQSLERAVALDPAYLDARKTLARLYSEQGKTSRARLEWEKVLSLNPGDPEAAEGITKSGDTTPHRVPNY
jgi:tetratricopeptide (TPR) repeat protein